MKKHTKVYVKYFGLEAGEYKPCEWCNRRPVVDIHHISPRGMGGSKDKDQIENLMGLCRECHNLAEAKKLSKEELLEKHMSHLIGDYSPPTKCTSNFLTDTKCNLKSQ